MSIKDVAGGINIDAGGQARLEKYGLLR